MNVATTPIKKGAKMTKFHINTAAPQVETALLGPRTSSCIFDNIVHKCFRRVEGVTTIHKGYNTLVSQEMKVGSWVLVDHVDRALSVVEQGWSSQIEWEALGKVGGIKMHLRSYLFGHHFTVWADHKPLTSIFNNTFTPSSTRINHLLK